MIAIAAGAASGCSGAQGASGQPDVATPASSVTSSPSSGPSTTASATLDDAARARIPTAARAHTPQGAEAFARFYLEQVDQAWMAPDPELIRPYALESCKTCANYVGTIDWLSSEHLRYDGAPMKLGPSVVAPESRQDHAYIELGCNQEARHILRADGSTEETVRHRFGAAQVELMWLQQAWQVREIRVNL
jgi:hypothetical protein